jgi:hypothetical protein
MPTPLQKMSLIRKALAWSTALAVAGTLSSSPIAPAAAEAQGACAGLRTVSIRAGAVECTHGGDPVPSEAGSGALTRRLGAVTIPPAPCAGNGKGGRRIRVLYGYPDGTTNRIKHQKAKIRDAVALADYNLDVATADVAGQHYRLYCEDDVAVTVTPVKLVAIGDDASFSYGDTISSLANQVSFGLGPENFDGRRFVYSIFADNISCCYPYGGQANLQSDDRADPSLNVNNLAFGNRYSMIRWGFSATSEAEIFQHEVGHNLGAVQLSSPHSSGAFHCYDGEDIMCYKDGGSYFTGGGAMTTDCLPLEDGLPPFDCGGDDYYNGTPAPGSYLESHWNLTNSAWLTWDAS